MTKPTRRGEDATLADLLVTFLRHWKLAALVLVVVVGSAAVGTALVTPRYETVTVVLPLQEEPTLREILTSTAFESDVVRALDLAPHLGGGNVTRAAQALHDRVTVVRAIDVSPRPTNPIFKITVRWDSPGGAVDVANAYISSLVLWKPIFENETRAQTWQRYYEESGKNATAADEQVRTLVASTEYYRVLDPPVPPTKAVYPDWTYDLKVAGGLGLLLAALAPFAAEEFEKVSLRRRDVPQASHDAKDDPGELVGLHVVEQREDR